MSATAPEIAMVAHEARRAGAAERKPRPIRVRGIVLRTDWAAQPWPWSLIGIEFREELEAIELAVGGAINAPLEALP